MLVRNDKGIYSLSSFNNFKNLVCGFSTVGFGNMKPAGASQKTETDKNRSNFFRALSLTDPDFVTAQQIHGNRIAVLNRNNKEKEIKGVDGLVTKERNLFLLVFVADCLPILAFDPDKKIVGIAHAGWRGTLGKIAVNLITTLTRLGSNAEDILVGFGPAIEFCHYEVGADVAAKFNRAGLGKSVLRSISGKIYLDLKQANVEQLTNVGISKGNIDITPKACTYESADFYSYRQEKPNLSGEIACLIGLRND